jgi:integrase
LRAVDGQHEQWCFTYQGRRMDAVGSAWKRALRRAAIENFRFHDLRHTWASWTRDGRHGFAGAHGVGWLEVVRDGASAMRTWHRNIYQVRRLELNGNSGS